MKYRAILAIFVAALLTAMLSAGTLTGCKSNKNNSPNDNLPGADFSGSISDGNQEQTPPEPPKDEGDATKTYYIATADQLKEMKLKGTYILTADIDMTGQEWTPVGTYTSPFVGTFDGGGFTVIGLTVSTANSETGECLSYTYSYGGLFGYTKDAKISNVTLQNVNISVNSAEKYRVVYAGGISGKSVNTSFSNCNIASGSIASSSALFKSYSAGICAFSFGGTFNNCDTSANISVTASTTSAISGGIVAQAGEKTSITNCAVTGTVSATAEDGNIYSGGIAGYIYDSDITQSHSSATVRSTSTCSNSEIGKSGGVYAGGIVGLSSNYGEARCNLLKVYSHGTVTADSVDFTAYSGGISAHTSYTNIKHSYSIADVTAQSRVARAFSGGISSYTSVNVSYEGVFFTGSLTSESTGNAHAGVITAYDAATESKTPTLYTNVAYAKPSSSNVSINGINYGQSGFDSDAFLVKGYAYSSDDLKSRTVLVNDLGWNNDEWEFSISGFPELK